MSNSNTSRTRSSAATSLVAQRSPVPQPPPPRPRLRFWILTCITMAVTVGGTAIWVLSSQGILQNSLATFCGIAFTVIGFFLTVLQLMLQLTAPTTSGASANTSGNPSQQQRSRALPPGTTKDKGAIEVLVKKQLVGSTIYLSRGFDTVHVDPVAVANVDEQVKEGRIQCIGFFPHLEPGTYCLYTQAREYIANATVYDGQTTRVNWQRVRPRR